MTSEPLIAVGLVENVPEITVELLDSYTAGDGSPVSSGRYRFTCREGRIICRENKSLCAAAVSLTGTTPFSRFRLEITIGIDFHWQQKKEHTFSGAVRLIAQSQDSVTVINDVPLETYIHSVSCSEMSAHSPEEFLKAHSIISRSWLLAQLAAKDNPVPVPPDDTTAGEIIRWYDRQTHTGFDVCADDHCQRYQGVDMITSGTVSKAVEATRGMVLMYDGKPCDARFSKCCGGVVEDFRLAWSDTVHPYLTPLTDAENETLPDPPLTGETAARLFFEHAPEAYCNCSDAAILGSVLNRYDQTTNDFYRWTVTITHEEVSTLLQKKLSRDVGRVLALEPVKRGLSGRLETLRIVGEKHSVIIGKELEIRRALSKTHLYSSAFVVDTVGPADRPEAFILTGAGWGHGVGLCQIGAAVMAFRGKNFREILAHYYPGSVIEALY